MNPDDDTRTGRYVGRDDPAGGRGLFWVPPDAGPWEPLPPVRHRSVDGPNWGYEGNGPTDAAEAILLHATDGRMAHSSAILCDEVLAVRATWKRVLAGLATPPADGSLVFDMIQKKTKTRPAKYKLRGIVIAGAAHVALIERAFPGTEVA